MAEVDEVVDAVHDTALWRESRRLRHGQESDVEAHEKHGELTERSDLPNSVFAFPKKRKELLTDASPVRNALARFDQVEDVTDEEREQAFANIKKAAKHSGVEMTAKSWRELAAKG